MLVRSRTNLISVQFLMALALGVFVILYLPLHYQALSCSTPAPQSFKPDRPEAHGADPARNERPPKSVEEKPTDAIAPTSTKQREDAGQSKEQTAIDDDGWLRKAVCEARLTDVALVFFTYCLVIVGWATMRTTDVGARQIERAFLFLGTQDHQLAGTVLKATLTAANSGRSPGVLSEFYIAQPPQSRRGGLPIRVPTQTVLPKKLTSFVPRRTRPRSMTL